MFVQGEGSLKMKDVTFEGNQGVNGSALAQSLIHISEPTRH